MCRRDRSGEHCGYPLGPPYGAGGCRSRAGNDRQVTGTIDYTLDFWIELHLGYRSLNFDYTESLKPIHNVVLRTRYKIPLPPGYGPTVIHIDGPSPTDKVVYGGYLAGPVGHCVLCHTPPGKDSPFDMSRAYQGRRDLPNFDKLGALTVSRNITADPEHGIGKWSDREIRQTIRTGIRPDGTRLAHTMPFDWYTEVAPANLDAIVAYLRLPASPLRRADPHRCGPRS